MSAIKHRIATGRLDPVRRACMRLAARRSRGWRMDGRRAELWARGSPQSHQRSSAMADVPGTRSTRHVSISCGGVRSETGIVIHRRSGLEDDVTRCSGIPVTTPIRTLLGIATPLPMPALEAAVNEADKLNLVDPERLRADLETPSGQHGVRPLRALLDRATFTLTDSELERRFLRIARRAGLPKPRTQARVNGFRVDFYWPELGLVIETDGLRYHRTPSQQTRDRVRDQAHAAAGLGHLRFTHWQVRHDPAYVQDTLEAVAGRARAAFCTSGT